MVERDGAKAQLTGHRAETKVRDTLQDAGIFCSKYEIDRGEDLLVELEGYVRRDQSTNVEPRIGLLQIRGHEAASECNIKQGHTKRRLTVDHLRRWASIPLPVFIIAVEMHCRKPCFFVKSVDHVVTDVAPDGIGSLDQATLTVQVPSVSNLPAFLTAEIKSFYSAHAFQLSELSENVIARNHYEVIFSHTSLVPTTAKVWMKNIHILWKGPLRPAHFWATLNHIADSLQEKEGGRSRPLYAIIHMYRSLKDLRVKNAVANVSWLEDTHSEVNAIRELINWPRAKHWFRFRFTGKTSLDELSESFVSEEDDEVYLAKAKRVWLQLDELCQKIFVSLSDELRIEEDHRKALEGRFHKLDDYLSDNLGRPSPQSWVMDRLIEQYSSTISRVFVWLEGKEDLSEVKRKRCPQQDLGLLQGYFRAFQVLYKALRNG